MDKIIKKSLKFMGMNKKLVEHLGLEVHKLAGSLIRLSFSWNAFGGH